MSGDNGRANPRQVPDRTSVRRWAESLIVAASVQMEPVPLRPVAELCKAEVVFKPLLVAGATGWRIGGFRVYCNCPRDRIDDWSHRYSDATDLGTTLPVRARFTIAHELAHTSFYEVEVGKRPRALFSHRWNERIEELESLCDDGASFLLMPPNLLRERLGNQDLLDPGVLWALSDKFRVSPDAVVIRCERDGLWKSGMGEGALVVERVDGRVQIRTIAGDKIAKAPLEPEADRARTRGEKLYLDRIPIRAESLEIYGGRRFEAEGIVDGDRSIKFRIRQSKGSRDISILTLQREWS